MADRTRIEERLQALWAISHGPGGGADRPAFSPAEAQATRLVAGWARDAGLQPGLDEHGNLWALAGGSPAGSGSASETAFRSGPGTINGLVTAGSHVDTVPDGGRWDGALGTVLGLELAEDLPGAGLMVCVAEEAPRFGAGTIGSRLLTGALTAADLDRFRDADGMTAAEARRAYLESLSDLPRIQPPLARWRGHAEIHVAQRWALKRVGVVTRVASPRRYEAVVSGVAGHSGELSMDDRRDALTAAAELILAVEAAARAEPAETVATVGTLSVSPGAVSIVPGTVRLGIDVRAIDAASLDRVSAAVSQAAAAIAARRSVDVALTLVRDGAPVEMDAGLISAAAGLRRLAGGRR